ncbi:MAG: ParB N-terminal domain-containing protein [Thermoplasmata archaeon]
MRYRFAIVEIDKLRHHEEIQEDLLRKCMQDLENDGVVKYPILVDDEYLIVLDGHHRVEALKRLGCTRIPVYLVDYFDDDIEVTTWENAGMESITKEMIIEMGRSEKVFPPKTSRHILKCKLEEHPIPLEELK